MKEASNFRATKTYDVLIAAPLIVFYAFSLAGLRPLFEAALRLRPAWVSALQLLSYTSFALYLALTILLIFLRRVPVGRSRTAWPRALGILGSILLFALPLLPAVSLSPALVGLSALLTAGGTIAELLILAWLGRSFSLLPEARKLVTTGPYRYIRHPLYLAGLATALGAMLPFRQPWAFLIVLAGLACQLLRMRCEEQVLMRAFPEYADYAARTGRLIPGVY